MTLKGTGKAGTPHIRRSVHHVVALDCPHSLIFYAKQHCPRAGHTVWCPKCAEYRTVIVSPNGKMVVDFKARCRNCRLSRSNGGDRHGAEFLADTHAFAYHHVVDVYRMVDDEPDGEPVNTFEPPTGPTLDLETA